MEKIVKKTVTDFCLEYVETPHLCYTEHGIHALFFTRLYEAIPEKARYFTWEEKKVCVIQKEYSTAMDLGKSKRQHWDISVIDVPPHTSSPINPYDFFRLNSVVEFGMNASSKHIKEDIRRLSHPDSNVMNKFAVHLYRFSNNITRRDISPKSAEIVSPEGVREFVGNSDVTVFYAIADLTKSIRSGVWVIDKNGIQGMK